MDNLVTIVNNFSVHSTVIEDKPIKALNQRFNKQLTLLQVVYDRQTMKQDTKRSIHILKRHREDKAYFHQITTITLQ